MWCHQQSSSAGRAANWRKALAVSSAESVLLRCLFALQHGLRQPGEPQSVAVMLFLRVCCAYAQIQRGAEVLPRADTATGDPAADWAGSTASLPAWLKRTLPAATVARCCRALSKVT